MSGCLRVILMRAVGFGLNAPYPLRVIVQRVTGDGGRININTIYFITCNETSFMLSFIIRYDERLSLFIWSRFGRANAGVSFSYLHLAKQNFV